MMCRIDSHDRMMMAAVAALAFAAGCDSSDSAEEAVEVWSSVRIPAVGNIGGVVAIAFSPDQTRTALVRLPVRPSRVRASFAVFPRGVLETWDNVGGHSVFRSALKFEDLTWQPIGFSPDGRRVHFPGTERVVAWDVETSRLDSEPRLGVRLLSPDGRYAAVDELAALRGINDEATIRDFGKRWWVVDVSSDAVVSEIDFGGSELVPQIFSPDGKMLVVAVVQSYRWKEVVCCDVATGAVLHRREASANGARSGFSGDGRRLACAWETDVIDIRNAADGSHVNSFKPRTDRVRDIALSRDGRLLAAAIERDERGTIALVWDVDTGQLATRIAIDKEWAATAVAFTPDGARLAVGCPSGELHFFAVPES